MPNYWIPSLRDSLFRNVRVMNSRGQPSASVPGGCFGDFIGPQGTFVCVRRVFHFVGI